jgi:hypothetical protein
VADKTPRTLAPLHLDDDPIGPPIELAPEDMFDEGYDEDFTQVDHDLLTQPMEAIVLELEAVPADEWDQ